MKEAVAAAQRYLNELYEEASDVRLEEVERTEQYPQDRDWLITLSFGLPKVDRPLDPTIAYTQIFGTSSRLPRHYKVFRIDADSGHVVSMKIRNLSASEK